MSTSAAEGEEGGHQKEVTNSPISQPTTQDGADLSSATEMASKPANTRSPTQIALIMLALCFAVFLHALDTTIVTTALPTITEALHSDATYQWIGSAYLLGVSATTIVWGKLSDIFGRRPAILAANVTFFAGSLIAALSVDAAMLITARSLQGIGGAGLNVLANVCIGDLFSPRERGMYYGIVGGVWAVALSLGPVIGGAFTEYASWHWCFYVNLPFCGIAFVIIFFFLNLETPKTPFLEGIRAIDWIGVLLSLGSTLLFLLGLSFGGVTDPWRSATVICLIVFGFFGWAVFFGWEISPFVNYPLLPVDIFRRISNLAILGVCFVQSYVFIASAYYLPLYFQGALGATPILSGVYLLPTAVSLSVASIGTGMYMRKTGQYIIPMYIGFVLQLLGYGLFISLGSEANWPKIILYQVIAGVGVGPNFQAPMVALQSFIAPREVAAATSCFAFTRNLAGAVSIVIGQVVFQNQIKSHSHEIINAVGPDVGRRLDSPAAGANIGLVKGLPYAQRRVVHIAFADSLRDLWIMYTAVSAVAILIMPFIGSKKKLTDEHKETKTGLEAEKAAKEERQREKRGRVQGENSEDSV